MLIRLKLRNFLSFSENKNDNGEELSHEFCMIPGPTRQHDDRFCKVGDTEVLKFSAIYGANASGKTNLIKALAFIKQTVVSGLPKNSSEMFCRTDADNEFKSSYFEIQFSIDERCYIYGFEVLLSKGEFISESLIEAGIKRKRKLFTRDIRNGRTELSDSILSSRLKIYSEDISNDSSALLITVMSHNKSNFYDEHPEAIPLYHVFQWLSDKLNIISSDTVDMSYIYASDSLKYKKIRNMLHRFDTGITGYDIYPGRSDDILFRHGDITLPLSGESSGTLQLIGLLKILLIDETDDSTYIVDNLDSGRSLHPLLTYHFVKSFLDMADKRRLQLIVTSHEVLLMDFNLLRRDEIWFIDKNDKAGSRVYSLDKFNIRFDKIIGKAYLKGDYGGVPVFET